MLRQVPCVQTNRFLFGLACLGTSQTCLAIPPERRGNLCIYHLQKATDFHATGTKAAVCEIFLVAEAGQKFYVNFEEGVKQGSAQMQKEREPC